ncbi:MAG: DUF3488 and transglutaminase-like domain-containing protein [Pontiella sp.]
MNTFPHHRWVLLTLVLAALPSLLILPFWVAGIALAGVAFHYSAPLRKGWGGKVASIGLLAATAGGIYFSFDSLFSGKSVLSFFIAVVFLKFGESRTRRDYLLLIFAAVILAAVGALYWENLWSLVHMLVVIFSLTLSLVAIHGDPAGLTARFLGRLAGQLFLLGLPLMLLLFMTFPRIPGPLWDIGLAFGLPIKAMLDRGDGEFGKAMTLQPGGIHQAGEEDGNVVVAEFEEAVPSKSLMYWRGPVFYEYNGAEWTLPENWNNRNRLLRHKIRLSELDKELTHRGHPVDYTLRVMPNGARWLYALDVPAASAPEAFISEDLQLLSIRTISDQEPKFTMRAYLEYNVGTVLSETTRARALSWPQGTNPRLKARGAELAEQFPDSEEIVFQAFRLLAQGEYRFDAAHIIAPGSNTLDRFFFDEKKGGAEYLAGSFVMLMRAAGVPARLVSGYRGGSIIALTNFVIVKRSNAHAWVEVWHEQKGWVRVEPKDIVLPPEKKRLGGKEDLAAEKTRIEVKQADAAPPPEMEQTPEGKGATPPATDASEGKRWKLPSLSDLFSNLQKWVIHYNPDRQTDLLEGVGLEESNWLDLLIGGALGVFSLLGTYLGIAWWRGRTKMDPVSKAWKKLCARLLKLGLEKGAQECPRDYLRRACLEQPELAEALDDVIGRYIDIRYGGDDSSEAKMIFKRQVERFVAMT